MTLPADARRIIENFPLGFVATVTADRRPAVSPKGTFLVLDDRTLAFADIRSPGTIGNLHISDHVEINFFDMFIRKAARVRGIARVLDRDTAAFDDLMPHFRAQWPDLARRIRHIVTVRIETAAVVTTPLYDDGATEAEMIALYKRKVEDLYP